MPARPAAVAVLLLLAAIAPPSPADGQEERCALCPKGASIQFPDELVGGDGPAGGDGPDGETCADRDAFLSDNFAEGVFCDPMRAVFLADYPLNCGYCLYESRKDVPRDACTLCADGRTPKLPADTVTTNGFFDCGELAYWLLSAMEGGEDNCTYHQEEFGTQCGCRSEEKEDDEEKCTYPAECDMTYGEDAYSDYYNLTCSEIAERAWYQPRDGWVCEDYTWSAVFECGCPYVPPLDSNCTLCSDGTDSPDPTLELIPGDVEMSCGNFDWLAAMDVDAEECAAFRATAGALCGCADPPEAACDPPCKPGQEFNASLIFEESRGDDGETVEVHCGEVLFDMSEDGFLCNRVYLYSRGPECCVGDVITDPPTVGPTAMPTVVPTVVPTDSISDMPSPALTDDAPTEAPVDAGSSTEAPVDTAAPTEAPVDTAAPTEAPVDTLAPTEAPVDVEEETTAAPTEAPAAGVVETATNGDGAPPTQAPAGVVETAAPSPFPADPSSSAPVPTPSAGGRALLAAAAAVVAFAAGLDGALLR